MSRSPAEMAAELLDHYAQIAALTADLRAALERDDSDPLDSLTERRATQVAEAETLVAELRAAETPLDPALQARLTAALASVVEEDGHLRALLAARSQELPAQLAELRGARRGLAGYQRATLGNAEYVDRSG